MRDMVVDYLADHNMRGLSASGGQEMARHFCPKRARSRRSRSAARPGGWARPAARDQDALRCSGGHHHRRSARRDRPGGRAGTGRRRLPHQAVQPSGTAGAHSRRVPTAGGGTRGVAAGPASGAAIGSGTGNSIGGAGVLPIPAGDQVALTKGEYALLTAFLDAPQRPLSREHLLQATRVHEDIFDRSIDVQILRLRRKLEADPSAPQIIQTERGVGYVFALPVETL